MNDIEALDDTIAAIATAMGPGGIGIVRVSGPKSLAIADGLFKTRRGKKPSQFKSHSVHLGHVADPKSGEIIDEALLTVMLAPKSYTCEDVVEISSHGGLISVKTILELILELGARLAEPGEFTKRAFLNGRLDLVQAEAVQDIIQAKTKALLKISANQLKGELTLELERIREDLLEAYIQLEALINFPDDDIENQGKIKISGHLFQAREIIHHLLKESDQGRLLREGIQVVLCGRPNVGKSSLLNVLLKQPRAIVSDIAGTTRDTIEESAQIRGIPLQLVDTAGILEPRDLIEKEAVDRSRIHMQNADLVLFILNNQERLTEEDLQIIKFLEGQNILVVVNKMDLPGILSDDDIAKVIPGKKIVRVCARTKTGIPQLEEAIEKNVLAGRAMDPSRIILTNTRHIEALKNACAAINDAEDALGSQLSLEFVSEHLKAGINALDRITGRDIDDDLLENIFSSFCIGK